MNYIEINYLSLCLMIFLLLIPVYISIKYNLGIIKKLFSSTTRMVIQLLLIGIFLKYIFKLNNIWLNLSWFIIMMLVASYSIVDSSSVNKKRYIFPVTAAVTISSLGTLLFFDYFVLGLKNIVEAQYFIPIGGMILGNSLKGNIVGVSTFFKNITKNEKQYFYSISMGATREEAVLPFVKESIELSINPTISSMATVGIISLPGMMTGQILGGTDPMSAIKYQIAIMILILSSSALSMVLTLIFAAKISFDSYGIPRKDILKK